MRFAGPIWESYKPHPYQLAFHQCPAVSPFMVKAGIGGLGSGKSTCMENEFVELCLRMPNAISIAIRKSKKRAQFAMLDDFKKMLNGIATWKQRDEAFTFKNGHQMAVMPADDWNRYSSTEISHFFIQEAHEVDGRIFEALCDRARSPYARIDGEPYFRGYVDARGVTNRHWIYKDIIEKAWKYDDGPEARRLAENPDFVYFQFRTEMNRQNLAPDYIETRRRQHRGDINWIKVMLEGEVGIEIDGVAVFGDAWDRDRHVAEITEDPSLPILRSWDFGYRAPCVLWCQYTRSGRLLVLHELCPADLSTDALIDVVKAHQAELWPHRPGSSYRDYGDIAGDQPNSGSDTVDIEKVENAFGTVIESRKARIESGLNVVRRLMRDSVKVQGKLVPRFAVDQSCETTIQACDGAYSYPEGQTDKPLLDRMPVKGNGYDRIGDCLRYIAQLVVEEGYQPQEYSGYTRDSGASDGPDYYGRVG